jgi:hypothetical protein
MNQGSPGARQKPDCVTRRRRGEIKSLQPFCLLRRAKWGGSERDVLGGVDKVTEAGRVGEVGPQEALEAVCIDWVACMELCGLAAQRRGEQTGKISPGRPSGNATEAGD